MSFKPRMTAIELANKPYLRSIGPNFDNKLRALTGAERRLLVARANFMLPRQG